MGEPFSFIVYAPDGSERREADVRTSGYLTPQFRWKFQRLEEEAPGLEADVARA